MPVPATREEFDAEVSKVFEELDNRISDYGDLLVFSSALALVTNKHSKAFSDQAIAFLYSKK